MESSIGTKTKPNSEEKHVRECVTSFVLKTNLCKSCVFEKKNQGKKLLFSYQPKLKKNDMLDSYMFNKSIH